MIVAIISPNSEARDVIATAAERIGEVEAVWSLSTYPEPSQLKDLPQDPQSCTVFLDFSDAESAKALVEEARRVSQSIGIVALTPRNVSPEDLVAIGVRNHINLPPTAREVRWAYDKVNPRADLQPEDAGVGGRVFAFLPARPAAGATTLAVHTAAAVARLSRQRTLLMDFDFRLGMTSFLLKLTGAHSVIDALEQVDTLDQCWESFINRRDGLDILGSAPQEFSETNLDQRTAMLVNYARRRYQTVVVDLPGEMREYEIDVLRRASTCFLVCNSDIGVMHMAQRKAEMLRELKLDDKVSVVINRAGGLGMISPRDVEAILHLPVRFSVANAYKEIAEVTREAGTLEGRGGVITQIENIARWMMPQSPQQDTRAEESGARRLLEFFGKGGGRAASR